MAPQTLAARMDSLEARVTLLEQLPARVDALASQVSQLRDEMRSEFSAVRGEIQTGLAKVMTHARVLHEDQKVTIAFIAERVQSLNESRGSS